MSLATQRKNLAASFGNVIGVPEECRSFGEIAERAIQRPQKQTAVTRKAGVHQVGIVGRTDPDQAAVELRQVSRFASELVPAYRALIGEVPNALFFVEQQIERGVDKIGDVGRGK